VQQIKILHNVATIGTTSLGLGQISVSLAEAQNSLKYDVNIWCLDNDDNITWASATHDFPRNRITGFKLLGPSKFWYSPAIKKAGSQAQESFDIVHQHGMWTGVSAATLKFSREKKVPAVVAPHGSLNEWALNLSRWKKKIALTMYERENLVSASCLHATSENEISDFRKFGLKNPIAYIENGIQEKYLTITGDPDRFRQQYAIQNNKRVLLFLSRISPKKGLEMLLEAISSIGGDFKNWQLIIAGIDEFDHKKDVELLIKKLDLEGSIKITGPLFGDIKHDAFAAAELFILPSHSEGFPMVVLDSLAAGVPVITTKASSWNDLNEFNCGWWTDINSEAIRTALKEAINKSAEELHQMGEQGKKLIASKYTWSQLAQKTIRLYDWLLGRSDKPDFVQLY
jgi:glycosyltransferase involved in cell wall biosynthesis